MTRIARLALIALTLLPVAALAQEIPPADIVILGEVHDNPTVHQWQAEAVANLRPRAVIWEMLTPAQAEATRGLDLRDAAAVAAATGWAASGWPAFFMYHQIFAASPEALHLGAALTGDEARQASREGAAAVSGPAAGPLGLTRPRDPADQAAREAEQAQAHCDLLPAHLLPGMVEVQTARDAAMAQAAIDALRRTGGPVVVITGNGHARRDRGIPAYIASAAPDLSVFSVGYTEGAPAPGLYDLTRIAPPVDRGDPCDALRKPD